MKSLSPNFSIKLIILNLSLSLKDPYIMIVLSVLKGECAIVFKLTDNDVTRNRLKIISIRIIIKTNFNLYSLTEIIR